MSVIHILPDRVANQIAAGEVVERPASIVKELLENSLDAGAARIEVNVDAGGKRLIRVADDGCGMDRDDALQAFERHATSKIRRAEDLLDIATLGFRGEALPSIAAVARVVLETRDASSAAGTRVEIAGGKLRDVSELAWPGGTRIEVRDLFFNMPARRKFLKSESTELGHVASLVMHYGLAHPEKSFRLTSLTNEILKAAPAPDARTRVYQLMGAQTLEQLIELPPAERRVPADASLGELEENEIDENGVVRLTGFVSRPEVQRLNRNEVYFFVNRRLVRDRLILHAITEAYRNILPNRMFPVALVFLEIPPREVDVNVHPSKTEVRFRHSGFIHDFTRDAIRQALIAARPVAAFPVRRQDRQADSDDAEVVERLAQEASGVPTSAPSQPANSFGAFDRTRSDASDPGQRALQVSANLPASKRVATPSHFGSPALPVPGAASGDGFTLSPPTPPPAPGRLPFDTASGDPVSAGWMLDQRDAAKGAEAGAKEERGCRPGDSLAPAVPAGGAVAGGMPADLQPIGQVEESYIVATNAAGLWIVDQHAAHERVLFERHLRQVQSRAADAQRLLLPIIVELKPQQQAVFAEIAGELVANGFEVEPFGQRTVAIKTAPAELAATDAERLLIEILDTLGQEARSLTLDVLRNRISASLACRAAIKVHMPLDRAKMEWLLRELGRAESPMACPHGRPVMLRYSIRDLERAFRRT